jgi:tRNA nucleotidyltransferase/poly(A) polymerase
MNEDSTSKFSTDNTIGQDDFPTYNNNIVDEDLEYNHVNGDATQDEYEITESDIDMIVERILSSMNGSSTVNVKKKCRLGGLGNTSSACNQGDINNFEIKPLKECNLIEIIKEESLNLSNRFYDWFKNSKVVDAQGKPLIVYHGTNKDFTRFSLNNAAQPIIWFSADKDKIMRGESGAAGRSRIIPAYLSIQKMAGWNEYEKYGLGQLQDMGYDGAKLYDDYFVFNPRQIKIIKEKTNEEVHDFHLYKEEIMNEAQLISLQDLPFKQEIEQLGGKIFSVGGAVRDEFLGKESKDLDILITGIPMDKLELILARYGKVDAVGKSFGILKFKPKGATDDIDIAIPRSESATGEGGHRGFEVKSDHDLPIEADLKRRDFTINAIAKDINGNIVDPYGGQKDLKDKIIRVVNPEAFSDDPLRMLRAVQFASRFGFTIEPLTMKMIQDNASRIKEIPPERILTEFDKIIHKGNKRLGAQLLKNTGLFNNIFGFDLKQSTIDRSPFEEIVSMGEFIFLLSRMLSNPSEFYKNNLKGDLDSYKEIKALELAYQNYEETNPAKARAVAHNMYLISPLALQSKILPSGIKIAANELLQGKYPKTVNELAVNGGDLMQIGLKGKEIGDAQKNLLIKIYSDKVANNEEMLLNSLNQKESLNESYTDVKASLMRSKSISKEMKELISKYLTGGSTYHEGGHIHGLMKPKEFTEKTPKSSGVSLGADKNGFYCYTHRARCKSYELPEKISVKDINFIESTG